MTNKVLVLKCVSQAQGSCTLTLYSSGRIKDNIKLHLSSWPLNDTDSVWPHEKTASKPYQKAFLNFTLIIFIKKLIIKSSVSEP